LGGGQALCSLFEFGAHHLDELFGLLGCELELREERGVSALDQIGHRLVDVLTHGRIAHHFGKAARRIALGGCRGQFVA
jgi:hypothetical protein